MKTKVMRYLGALVAISVLFVASGCKLTSPAPLTEKHPPLRIPYTFWTGYHALLIAKEKGFFAQQRVDVDVVIEEDLNKQISNFVAGKFDGIPFAIDALLRILTKDSDVRVVLSTGQSLGADFVLAQPQIQNISDLKGKKVGLKIGSFAEIFISDMLAQNGLTVDDVTLINASEIDVPKFLKDNTIQAGHTWEPNASAATKDGAKEIFTSKQTTPGLLPDIWIFRGSVLRERPEDIRAFIRAWFQAVEYWNANSKEGSEIVGKILNVPPADINSEGYQLYSLQEARNALGTASRPGSLSSAVNTFVDFFIQTGELGYRPDVDQLLDASFMPPAATPR